jgi:hypothetical protein
VSTLLVHIVAVRIWVHVNPVPELLSSQYLRTAYPCEGRFKSCFLKLMAASAFVQIEKIGEGKYVVHTDKGKKIETGVVLFATGGAC